MSLYVVDASVVVKWFVPEDLSDASAGFLAGSYELAAPDLVFPECGSILWKKARTGELSAAQALRIARALEALPLAIFPGRGLLSAALKLGLDTGRSVYDCVYLALAVALDCRLISADKRLANALAGGPLASRILWVGVTGKGSS